VGNKACYLTRKGEGHAQKMAAVGTWPTKALLAQVCHQSQKEANQRPDQAKQRLFDRSEMSKHRVRLGYSQRYEYAARVHIKMVDRVPLCQFVRGIVFSGIQTM
jgi:hypothetical protein